MSNKFVPYRPNYDLVANSVWKYLEVRYTNTATNEFQKSGISFTVPANRAVEFYAYDRKDAAYLDSIVVCDSESNLSTRTTTIVSINRIESDGFTDAQYWTLQTTGIIPTYNAAVTYYVWVKRKSTGSNPVGLAYRFIS